MNVISWRLWSQVGACMARFDWMLALAGSRPGGRHTFFLSRQKESKQRKRRRYLRVTLRMQSLIGTAPAPRLHQWCAIAPHVQQCDALYAPAPQRSPADRRAACRVGVAPVNGPRDTSSTRLALRRWNTLESRRASALAFPDVRSNSALTLQARRRRRLDQGFVSKRTARMLSASFFAYFLSGATERKYAARRGGTRHVCGQRKGPNKP